MVVNTLLVQVRSFGQVGPSLQEFAGTNQPFTERGKVGLESVGRMRKTDPVKQNVGAPRQRVSYGSNTAEQDCRWLARGWFICDVTDVQKTTDSGISAVS